MIHPELDRHDVIGYDKRCHGTRSNRDHEGERDTEVPTAVALPSAESKR